MQPSSFPKFGFRIHTRSGATVDNLVIAGQDQADAVRKLRQMYRDCEIVESGELHAEAKATPMSFEDIAKIING